ncbi:MAG: type IV pilus biogenesis/stability protein PilW [Gammaproteobacteria bacterium]|nr:type IV pilus biogenesis/stability protein PilW [Gammaproteobacteria bacterium]
MYINILIIFIASITLTISGCSETYNNSNNSLTNNEASNGNYGNVDLTKSAKYNLQLGVGYLEQGDVERAKDKFLKAAKQAPKMPEVHYNLAHFYYLIDDLDSADQHFNQALDYSADNTNGVSGTAHNNYGVFLCQTKQYTKAYEQFAEAVNDKNYADTASAYENAGLCALKAGDKSLAKHNFAKALKQNPLSEKSLIELSQLSVDNKDFQKAKAYLYRYNQTNTPDKRSLMLNLEVAKSLGDMAEVKNISAIIREKFPDLVNLLNLLNEPGNDNARKYKKSRQIKISQNANLEDIKYMEIGKLNKNA